MSAPKNPHAVALGRKGGRAGRGASKARKITAAMARAAAQARWGVKATPMERIEAIYGTEIARQAMRGRMKTDEVE